MRKLNLPKLFRKDWLKALESGEYQQGQNNLYNRGKYCCLGVAGCVVGVDKKILSRHSLPAYFDDEIRNKFPKLLRTSGDSSFALTLANKNDSGKYTFKEIAKFIRKNTKGV